MKKSIRRKLPLRIKISRTGGKMEPERGRKVPYKRQQFDWKKEIEK